MTTEEIGKIFGLKPLTIRQWLRDGKIKGVKVNGYWRVWRSELNRLAQEMYGAND